jgi:hypothetical protein
MKKVGLLLALSAIMMIAVGIAIGDETVPFPFWQHGWGCTTFWSASQYGGSSDAVVTVTLLGLDGTQIASTTGTVAEGTAWAPDSGSWGGWYTQGNAFGFGLYQVTSTMDTVYLWGCIYGGLSPSGQAGYTLVMPANPYGVVN